MKKLYTIEFAVENPVWVNKPSFFDPYYEEFVGYEYIADLYPDYDEESGEPEILFECEEKDVYKIASEIAKNYWSENWYDENGNQLNEDAKVVNWYPTEVKKLFDFIEDGVEYYYYKYFDGREWRIFG